MTQTIIETAKQAIETYYSKTDILTAHKTGNFETIKTTLINKGFVKIGLDVVIRDIVQNIVLENFEVVENEIVEKGNSQTKQISIETRILEIIDKTLNDRFATFRLSPSAKNYANLQNCMLSFQAQKQIVSNLKFEFEMKYKK